MIKKCKAIWKNEAVAVVRFDDVNVQVPAEMMDGDEITLEHKGDSFYVLNEKTEAGETDEEEPEDEDDTEDDAEEDNA